MCKSFVHPGSAHLKEFRVVPGVVKINKFSLFSDCHMVMIKTISKCLTTGGSSAGKDLLEQKPGSFFFQFDLQMIFKGRIFERNGWKRCIFEICVRLHDDPGLPPPQTLQTKPFFPSVCGFGLTLFW